MARYIGQNIADRIGRLAGLAAEDREVVAYGLEYLLSGMLALALILLAGLALNLFWETLVVLCCWGLLRQFAGGAHCTALWRCTVANITGIVIAVQIAIVSSILIEPAVWIAICIAWAFFAVWIWAPNNSEKPVSDLRQRIRLRSWAQGLLLFVGAALFYPVFSGTEKLQLLAVSGATGFAAGALMLSPPGFRLIGQFDKTMIYLHQRYITNDKGGETR